MARALHNIIMTVAHHTPDVPMILFTEAFAVTPAIFKFCWQNSWQASLFANSLYHYPLGCTMGHAGFLPRNYCLLSSFFTGWTTSSLDSRRMSSMQRVSENLKQNFNGLGPTCVEEMLLSRIVRARTRIKKMKTKYEARDWSAHHSPEARFVAAAAAAIISKTIQYAKY